MVKKNKKKSRKSKSHKEFLINIGVLIATIFVFLIFFEVVLRLTVDYELFPQNVDTLAYNNVSGVSFKPNIEGLYNSKVETRYHFKTNNLGWRDDDVFPEKTRFRVEIVGDSVTAGTGVDQTEMFTEVLEKELLDNKVEIINFGLGATGTGQQLSYFENKAKYYSPDMVILEFSVANDWANNEGAYKKLPYYTLENNTLKLNNFPPKEIELTEITYSFPLNIHVFFSNNLYTYNFLYKRLLSIKFIRQILLKSDFTRKGLAFLSVEMFNANASYYQDSYLVTRALIDAFAKSAKEINSSFYVLIVPTKEQVYEQDWQAVVNANDLGFELDRDLPTNKLSEICEDLNLSCINLLPVFREKASKGNRFHFHLDAHPTGSGHRIIAEVIYEQLLKK
ncbi:hypothetical protein ACFL0W_01480 [Nanoarchaeota archaeon]